MAMAVRAEIGEPIPVKKPQRGGPAFLPTDEQRMQVQTLAGLGMRHDEIALVIFNPTTGKPIDEKTLRKRFPQELKVGPIRANVKVAESLYRMATGKGQQALAAAIWWSKCRMGWKENVSVDLNVNTGVLYAPPELPPDRWVEMAKDRTSGSPEPGTEE